MVMNIPEWNIVVANPRSCGGNHSRMILFDMGIVAASPAPRPSRDAIMFVKLVAAPVSTPLADQIKIASALIRRAPYRSASHPHGIRKNA